MTYKIPEDFPGALDPVVEYRKVLSLDFFFLLDMAVRYSPNYEVTSSTPDNGVEQTISFNRVLLEGELEGPVDIVLLQDVSGSFDDDLNTVRGLLPSMVSSLKAVATDLHIGVAVFCDKPAEPFGSYGDVVYQTLLPLTSNIQGSGNELQATYNTMTVTNGNDGPESQFEALMQAALRVDELNYRADARKLIVLFTDAESHMPGDGKEGGITNPNNGDAVLDRGGLGEDYPSLNQVRAALNTQGIVPVIAATSECYDWYQARIQELGIGSVVLLTSNSSNLVNVILDSLNYISTPESPLSGRMSGVKPNSQITIKLTDKNGYSIQQTVYVDSQGYFYSTLAIEVLATGRVDVRVTGTDPNGRSFTLDTIQYIY